MQQKSRIDRRLENGEFVGIGLPGSDSKLTNRKSWSSAPGLNYNESNENIKQRESAVTLPKVKVVMKRRGQIIAILGVFFARCLFAVEIGGTVSEATADTATIITDSDLVPSAGDRVEIFFKIPGTDDEVLVGTARVSGIGRGKVGSVREGKGVNSLQRVVFGLNALKASMTSWNCAFGIGDGGAATIGAAVAAG
jgi:hypothetical protein